MDILPDLTKHNISLYTIPVYWLICLSPKVYMSITYRAATKSSIDNRQPRAFSKTVASSTQLSAETKDCLIRADAAASNGFENFGLFGAAVVAASVARVDPAFVNAVTVAFLVSRVVYNYVYIFNTTAAKAQTRSLTYSGGMLLLFSLFVRAGNQFW